jgi:uncharacterized protein YceH (UPF0502 family)
MLPLNLSANEIRVIGCLMEKSVTTPEQYPLTLNALTNACNQKSSRNPVTSLSQGSVQHTVRELADRHLLRIEENFKRGVEKYSQRFCNTPYSELQFDAAGFAVVCLLLLRGPQTPGELRARSGRLYQFDDNQAVVTTLEALNQVHAEPLVVRLPRIPGRRDSEYMHLFGGPVDDLLEAQPSIEPPPAAAPRAAPARDPGIAELERRVSELESEVARLKQLLD